MKLNRVPGDKWDVFSSRGRFIAVIYKMSRGYLLVDMRSNERYFESFDAVKKAAAQLDEE